MFDLIYNGNKKTKIYAPINGLIISLDELNDSVFSKRQVGEGVAIQADGNQIYAPASGVVTMISKTNHAIGIKLDLNIELLVHIGLDTSGNEHIFESCVKVGQRIKKKELLMRFDFHKVQQLNVNFIVLVLVLNSQFHTFSKVRINKKSYEKKSVLFEVL